MGERWAARRKIENTTVKTFITVGEGEGIWGVIILFSSLLYVLAKF